MPQSEPTTYYTVHLLRKYSWPPPIIMVTASVLQMLLSRIHSADTSERIFTKL